MIRDRADFDGFLVLSALLERALLPERHDKGSKNRSWRWDYAGPGWLRLSEIKHEHKERDNPKNDMVWWDLRIHGTLRNKLLAEGVLKMYSAKDYEEEVAFVSEEYAQGVLARYTEQYPPVGTPVGSVKTRGDGTFLLDIHSPNVFTPAKVYLIHHAKDYDVLGTGEKFDNGYKTDPGHEPITLRHRASQLGGAAFQELLRKGKVLGLLALAPERRALDRILKIQEKTSWTFETTVHNVLDEGLRSHGMYTTGVGLEDLVASAQWSYDDKMDKVRRALEDLRDTRAALKDLKDLQGMDILKLREDAGVIWLSAAIDSDDLKHAARELLNPNEGE